jgi:endonuclease YncB( thermonuclease family)
MLLKIFTAGLLLFFLHTANADTLTGRVVGITDGDTITVLDASNQQHKIRLSAIDTPEKAQPWGQKAKESLSDMVFNRQVTVDWHKTDRYGRTIGKVIVDGVDANLGQIKAGMAWHYKQYAREQPEDDRILYAEAEDIARMLKKGLWSDNDPVPPWDWRKGK